MDNCMELNYSLEFTFFDQLGRVLKLRCGHVSVAHPKGWFAVYVNNEMVYITDKEPECGISEVTNFATVQKWAERVFDCLFIELQNSTKP